MAVKDILRIVPALQSLALVRNNLRLASKKKVKAKDLIKVGTTNIIGTALIKEEASFIEGFK